MEVYILYSEAVQRYYVGFSKHASEHLVEHRKERQHWTACAQDWVMVWKKNVDSTAEARALEKRIKARGAKRFLSGESVKTKDVD